LIHRYSCYASLNYIFRTNTFFYIRGQSFTQSIFIGYQRDAFHLTVLCKLPYVLYGEDEEDVKSEVPVEEPVEIGNPVYLPTLQKGSRGESVKALQILLTGTEPGYPCGKYGIDGDFGSATENAVRNFQKAKGIEVDGIVGPVTWAKLMGV